MFDLELELKKFLRSIESRKLVSKGCIDEIESHLRDDIDSYLEDGLSNQEALRRACGSFGNGHSLVAEYEKLFGESKRHQVANVLSYYFDKHTILKLGAGISIALLFMLSGLALGGGHLHSVIQLTSFVLVFGVALGLGIMSSSLRKIFHAYHGALQGKRVSSQVFAQVGRCFLHAGFVGALVGFIIVVGSMQRPYEIGPGLAISLVSLLYGFLGYLFFGLGFEAAVAARNSERGESRQFWKNALMLIFLVFFALVGGLGLGFGLEQMSKFVSLPAILVVASGVVVLSAYVRNFGREHLQFLANSVLSTGIVSCLFHYIHVMETLDQKEEIFGGLSASLLPLLYSTVISTILRGSAKSENSSELVLDGMVGEHVAPLSLTPYCVATVSLLIVSTVIVMYALNSG